MGKALYPTRSISTPTLIIFCGNIIAKDCCVVRAGAMADHWDIVNIRDKEGNSTWPGEKLGGVHRPHPFKNLDQSCTGRILQQPNSCRGSVRVHYIRQGSSLKKFKFLVAYGDPSPGESKAKKGKSFKAVMLMGKLDGKLYVIKSRLAKSLNAEFIDWYVQLLEYVGGVVPVYCYMENNKLQDPFFSRCSGRLSQRSAKRGHPVVYPAG